MDAYGLTDRGCVRPDNQDRILVDRDLGLFIVADGMGGHRHGALAAEVAIATIKSFVESSCDHSDVTWPFGYNFDLSISANRLVTAVRLANRQVWRQAETGPEYAGMGTTVTAVLLDGMRAVAANVGDSRVYLFRAGLLKQLTVDDTWLSAVLERGLLTAQQLRAHPMRHILTQAAGSQHDVDVHAVDVELEPGDTLLLSSDGLHGVVPAEVIGSILSQAADAHAISSGLVETARSQGAPDNVSCVLIKS